MLSTPFQLSTPPRRKILSITHGIKPIVNNPIFKYTDNISFEQDARSIETIPLLRENI